MFSRKFDYILVTKLLSRFRGTIQRNSPLIFRNPRVPACCTVEASASIRRLAVGTQITFFRDEIETTAGLIVRRSWMTSHTSRLLGDVKTHPSKQPRQTLECISVHGLGEDVGNIVIGGDLPGLDAEVFQDRAAPRGAESLCFRRIS